LFAASERKNLMNRIGLAIRSSLDPAGIERISAALLGEALKADRCFFAHLDIDLDYMQFGVDWHRADLASLTGEYKLSQFNVDVESLFSGGQNLIIEDTASGGWPEKTVAMLNTLQICSLIDIPFYRYGKPVAILCAAMDKPHAWSEEEITLAVSIADQTRVAIDAASLVQREHKVATTLQGALMPSLPTSVPGLDLDSHYEAASEESSMGGDFFASYLIGQGKVALIIGDVSGKGLQAASQVATIQNMLRYALLVERTVAAAVTELNKVVIAQDLLMGFATIWVGVYDTLTRTLVYSCCGHEPALFTSGTNEIKELGFSGPPLGTVDNFQYHEQEVKCSEGDYLLLYTDGLSEAGPDRSNFLGQDGLADILRRGRKLTADQLIKHIVDSARSFSRGRIHDDVCILAARIVG
jgi:serine phosphatase RsbU (regulator of sigma subunit)